MAVRSKEVILARMERKEEISHAVATTLAAQDILLGQATPANQENHVTRKNHVAQKNHMVLAAQESQITQKALITQRLQKVHVVQKSLIRTKKVKRIIKARANHRSQILLENYLGLLL